MVNRRDFESAKRVANDFRKEVDVSEWEMNKSVQLRVIYPPLDCFDKYCQSCCCCMLNRASSLQLLFCYYFMICQNRRTVERAAI